MALPTTEGAARDRWGREVSRTGSEADLARMIDEVEDYAEKVRSQTS